MFICLSWQGDAEQVLQTMKVPHRGRHPGLLLIGYNAYGINRAELEVGISSILYTGLSPSQGIQAVPLHQQASTEKLSQLLLLPLLWISYTCLPL